MWRTTPPPPPHTYEQIKQMQADGVGLIPVVRLIREKESCGLYDAKRQCDMVGGFWNHLQLDAAKDAYYGSTSETFQKIKSEVQSAFCVDTSERYKNVLRRVLRWAESVEGETGVQDISNAPGSIFEEIRKLLEES